MKIEDLFEAKASKEEAGYIPRPKNEQKCINCTMWRDPNKCSAVAGDISPNGWCEWYAGGAYGKRGKKIEEDGRIVKGVNTTVDVGPNEIKIQAAKFGNNVDRDGRPPTMSKAVKSKSTNVLYNLGLAENYNPKSGDIFKALNEYEIEDRHPNEKPFGPEVKPSMPSGTIRVKVSDVYDWYKLGQHISDLEGLGKHDFGQGPPEAILSFGSEDEEHKYVELLKQLGLEIVDVDPGAADVKGVKTDPTYNTENFADGKKPGRKGLAKRVGVPTKASVTKLRKIAKSSSGEKARMAHWMANMKSGKKK